MAVGDETIGFGGTIEINDGGGGSYVELEGVVTLGIPVYTTGTVESKRLNREVVKFLPTIARGETLTINHTVTHANWARVEALRGAEYSFRFTIPDDAGDTQRTVPGIITANKTSDLDPEAVTMIETTLQISDAES